MTAARTGKVDAVKSLLAHGANANAKEGTRGQTPLMWAAAEGNADVIRVLVAARLRYPDAIQRRIHRASFCRSRRTDRRRKGTASGGGKR